MGCCLPAQCAKRVPLKRASTTTDTLSDVEILRSEFGLFNSPQLGRPAFEPSLKVPLREGQGYGWIILLKTKKLKVSWREELSLPAPAPIIGIDQTRGRHTVSADKMKVTTEREVDLERGYIHNSWAVAAGDPKGLHVLRVYVEGKLARTFEFETE